MQAVHDFAEKYDIEYALIKAIANVETKSTGFYKGKPSILFERHVFYRNLEKNGINPDVILAEHGRGLVYPKPYANRRNSPKDDRYGSYDNQWVRFNKAKAINEDAAIAAISMGKFQVLGENWKMLGYDSPKDFFASNHTEDGQIDAFLRYISKRKGMIEALNAKDFKKIKILYNGKMMKDADRNGVDDYVDKLVKEYKREISRSNERKPLVKSKTIQANTASGVGAISVLSAAIPAITDLLNDQNEVIGTVVAEIDNIKESSASTLESIDSLVEVSNSSGDANVVLIIASAALVVTIATNVWNVYKYLRDGGYV